MSAGSIISPPFQCGAFRVEPARNRVLLGDNDFGLEPRVMDVLCLLAEHAGEVVPRDTLLDQIWGPEQGADESLTRAISLIRKFMREAGEVTPYIETIKKRGYRLRQPVTYIESEKTVLARPGPRLGDTVDRSAQAVQPHRDRPAPPPRAAPRWKAAAGGMLVLVGVAIAAVLFFRTVPTQPTAITQSAGNAVAVLPFRALSNDASDAWFGNGIAEELLNALARFPDLGVTARSSAFGLDTDTLDPRTVGETLGVDHIVQGSVRRSGDRLRVSVQLVRTVDRSRLWSETYEADAADLFSIEDQIVRAIASTLQVRLGVGGGTGRDSGAGVEPLAYEQYLQGLTLWGERMREDDTRARALDAFRRAVAFDPDFADAWAAIGMVGTFSTGSPLSRDSAAFRQMTEDALTTSLALDEGNALAHATRAVWHVTRDIDVPAALRHLARATSLAPNAVQSHLAAALVHRALGNADRALAAFDRAIAIDPLNAVTKRVRAELLVVMGRGDEAMAFFNACYATNCLSEGFVAFATAAAVMSGSATEMARWRPRVTAFEQAIENVPARKKPHVARVIPAHFSIKLDRPDANAQIERMRTLFESELITDTPGIWLPTFASFLPRDTFMDVLELAYARGDLFSASFAFAPLYGRNPFPDWVLQHKRYHALWAQPSMVQLAGHWRAHGRTAGLPITATPMSQ